MTHVVYNGDGALLTSTEDLIPSVEIQFYLYSAFLCISGYFLKIYQGRNMMTNNENIKPSLIRISGRKWVDETTRVWKICEVKFTVLNIMQGHF